MRQKNILLTILISITIATSIFSGCGKSGISEASTYKYADDQEISVIPLPEDLASPSENSIPVTLTFANLCGADIGMFSMIDPNTKEQLNLTSIADQESISIKANWPIDNMDFQWAIYDENGDLCIDATSDLTGIEKSVLVVISGDGNISSVDVTVE